MLLKFVIGCFINCTMVTTLKSQELVISSLEEAYERALETNPDYQNYKINHLT